MQKEEFPPRGSYWPAKSREDKRCDSRAEAPTNQKGAPCANSRQMEKEFRKETGNLTLAGWFVFSQAWRRERQQSRVNLSSEAQGHPCGSRDRQDWLKRPSRKMSHRSRGKREGEWLERGRITRDVLRGIPERPFEWAGRAMQWESGRGWQGGLSEGKGGGRAREESLYRSGGLLEGKKLHRLLPRLTQGTAKKSSRK